MDVKCVPGTVFGMYVVIIKIEVFFKKLKCYVFCHLSFEIVSYFDIRISNLVVAKGRAMKSVVLKTLSYNRLRIILASTAFTPFGYTRTGFRSISLISSRETIIFDTFIIV